MDSKYTPEQALAEATSPIQLATEAFNKMQLERARDEFDRDLERQKEQNKRQDRMLQGLVGEFSRRTKVCILEARSSGEMEIAVNDFLCKKQEDTDKRFTFLDIKYSAARAFNYYALIIYSEIDKPKEEKEEA